MKEALFVFVVIFSLVYLLGFVNNSQEGRGFIDAFRAIDMPPEKVEKVIQAFKEAEAFDNMQMKARTFICPHNSKYPEAVIKATRRIIATRPTVCFFHGDGTQIIDGKESSFTVAENMGSEEKEIIRKLDRAGVPAPKDFDQLCETYIEVEACGISNR